MTIKDYNTDEPKQKPKFDPNKPFEEVKEEKPPFDPNQPFEAADEPSKKKVGSLSYEHTPLASEVPSSSESVINRALKADELSKKQVALSGGGTGGGGVSFIPDKTSVAESKRIKDELKSEGYEEGDVNILANVFRDFPKNAKNVNYDQLLEEYRENPFSFKRHLDAYKWQTPLFESIRGKAGEEGEKIIQRIISKQQSGSYLDKRESTREAIEAVKLYVDGEENQKRAIAAIKSDKAFGYGDMDKKWDSITADPRYLGGSGLNNYQISALQYLEDTDPDTYAAYDRLLSVKPEEGSGKVGWEQKARELERLGMSLENKYLEENLTTLANKYKREGSLSPEEANEYQRLFSNYETLTEDQKLQSKRFPSATALDADMFAQEAIGQRNGALERSIIKVGENVDDAVNWFGDLIASPFRSEDKRVIDDLEDLGDKKSTQAMSTYTTAKNQLVQPGQIAKVEAGLKEAIDWQQGSLDERLDKVRGLISSHFGEVSWKPNPDADKLNLTANAWANKVADVGSELVSQLGLAYTTGGVGNISKARSLITLFGTTFATTYNDLYTEALDKNIKNPSTYATINASIQAATELFNNDLMMAKRLVNPKSTLGTILKNVTQQQWDDIARTGKKPFAKIVAAAGKTGKEAVKNAYKETLEEISGTVGSNVANRGVFGEDVGTFEGWKETSVNTFLGMLPIGILGLPGQLRSMNRSQKYALYEAAQNPEKYLLQLDKDVKDGVMSKEKADNIRTIIQISSEKLNELSERNTLSTQTDNEKTDTLVDTLAGKKIDGEKLPEVLIKEAIESGNLKGVDKLMAEAALEQEGGPDQFLSAVADQALNKIAPDRSQDEVAMKRAREVYGDELVNAAIKKFPKEKSPLVYSQRPDTELSHRGLQNVSNEFSLPSVEVRDRKSDDQLRQEARETVDDWVSKGKYKSNVEGLIVKAEDGGILTDKERVILEGHLANVTEEARKIREESGVKSEEYDKKLAEVKRLKDAGQRTRSEAGAALRIPTFRSTPSTLEDQMVVEQDAAGVENLTDAQKETVEKEFNTEQELKNEYEKKIAELQKENARLMAGEKVSDERKRARKGRKSKEDFSQERKKIVEDIKEKLKNARKDTQVTILPYAKELFAIAPEVSKLVRNLVEQGVTELSEIIDNIHEILSPDIDGITKKDVQDLVAGVYDEKKLTRSELAKTLYDLKYEAKLLNQLAEIESGAEPVTEKKKIERNRKIKELKDKIKNHDVSRLADEKKKIAAQIKKIEEQLEKGEFEKPKKPKVKLDKAGKELQAKLANLQRDRDIRRLKLQYEKRTAWQKGVDKIIEMFNIPRSIMASTDFSAPLNQAIVATIAYPSLAKEAAKEMFKSAFSQENFDSWFYQLKEDPRYELMKELKLGIADPHSPFLTAREEAFMSGYAEQIPVAGRLIKGSERAYVQYLNKMRVDIFNRFIDRFEENGKTYENNKKLYEKTARYINNITGRGNVGKLEQFAPIFNVLFFSPRLIAARINMLNPFYFATLPKELKVQYGKDMGKFLALGSIVVSLFSLYGATQGDDDEDKIVVEDDPRSSDFGKIKQGGTRWNIWGGFQPYVRVAAQMATGEKKSTTTGMMQELDGEGAFGQSRGSVAADFFRGKLAPVFSSAVDLIEGRNAVGEKVTLQGELIESVTPLGIGSVIYSWKERGYGSLYSVGLPSIFGVGTQTYGKKGPTIPEKIKVNNKNVELTKQQKDDLEKYVTEKTEQNINKLKKTPEYKALGREEQVALEVQVKRGALANGKEYIIKKYASSFPKETMAEKKERLKKEKEKQELLKKID